MGIIQKKRRFHIPSSHLIGFIILQWILFTVLIYYKHHETTNTKTVQQHDTAVAPKVIPPTTPSSFRGVAVTLMFRAPQWFHMRYTMMIHNALSNLPHDWGLQVFVNRDWVESNVFPYHPGLQRILLHHPRVITTPLPRRFLQKGQKQVFLDPWFWEQVAADRVLLFSGNGAFCGNHFLDIWKQLEHLDYCGTPTNNNQPGGNGSTHSYRNRTAMLQVLLYAHNNNNKKVSNGAEAAFFLDTMKEMNQKGLANFVLATREQTHNFGGVTNLSSSEGLLLRLPLVVSGTQAKLSWDERESLLRHCPEIKMIFPSLHEPSCFGAHPNGRKCQSTICALQDEIPKQGC